MVLLHSILAMASMAGLAHCQNTTTTTVDIQDIDLATRSQWCLAQTSSCPLLCLQLPGASENPTSNDCDDDTLAYSCVCDNGIAPNASEYSQTIPYFLCTEQNNECVAACTDNQSSCQEKCRTSNPCGAQSPKRANTTSTAGTNATTTATTTTSSLAPFTGEPNDEGGAARPLTDLTPVYGLVVVLGGFFAGFSILL
ncbi:hypothetical protein BJX76DRAFT_326516 [Aspergillus varians]